MAQLALTLFGTYELTRAGEPVAGAIPVKGRALLAYLAVEAHHPHPREVLAELLWPDHGPQGARDSLRDTLARMRLALGERTAAVPLLLITRDTIQWHAAANCALDVADFTALLVACTTHPHPRIDRCGPCMRRLTQAAALYRGDFLQQFTVGDSAAFEEWAALHRERLRRQALEALAHLAAYHEHRGDYKHASEYAERQVALDPWQEDAHRQVMRALALSGQRSAALAHYERCRRLLADDLETDPAVETTTLAAQIRAGTLVPPPPPPRRDTQLPVLLTSFIGRESERATLTRRLDDPGCRLLTLTGPGGVGKTRLAVQIAADLQDDFADGVAFVDLTPISDAALVVSTIATTLRLREMDGQPLLDMLTDYLREKQLLLVLDNFEQVVAAAPVVSGLLQAAPHLRIIVTSRVMLTVYGEHAIQVPPLGLPDRTALPPLEQLTQYAAVQLFIERAQATKSDFVATHVTAPAVAEICRHLDGLPLAIELAAARIRFFPPQALLQRLSNRLQVLTGGARTLPARQQTLRATLDWSYNLLDAREQALFRRLGVFVGGWSLEAADAVCTLDDLATDVVEGLQSLLDKSLLRQAQGLEGEPRFTLLETMREYALERLHASGEADRLRRRHAEHYLRLAEAAEHDLEQHIAHILWFERLEAEHDNLRAVLQWALDQQEAAMVVRLTTALKNFWRARGYVAEGARWLEAALAASADAAVDPALRAKALLAMGSFVPGNLRRRDALFEESLAVFQELGDSAGIALSLWHRGMVAKALGEYRRAVALFEEQLALERAHGNREGLSRALLGLGWMAHDLGDFGRAFTLLEESLAVRRELGDQPGIAFGHFALGVAAYQLGDFPRARGWLEASRTLYEPLGDKHWLSAVIAHLGSSLASQGDVEQAARLLDEALALQQALENTGAIALIRRFQGKAALQQRDWPRAQAALQESLRLKPDVGEHWEIAACLEGLAAVADGQGQAARAARLAGAAAALREQLGAPVSPGDRPWYEPAIAHARAALGEAGFTAAQAEGRAMTREQAVAYALETGG